MTNTIRPDWEAERCKICGQPNHFGFMIPDQLWEQLIPQGINIVCLNCLDNLAVAAGVEYAEHLTIICYVDHTGGAIVLEHTTYQKNKTPD